MIEAVLVQAGESLGPVLAVVGAWLFRKHRNGKNGNGVTKREMASAVTHAQFIASLESQEKVLTVRYDALQEAIGSVKADLKEDIGKVNQEIRDNRSLLIDHIQIGHLGGGSG